MIRDILAMTWAFSALLSIVCFVWGIGSAMMNGIQESSMGPMMVCCALFFSVSLVLGQLIGI